MDEEDGRGRWTREMNEGGGDEGEGREDEQSELKVVCERKARRGRCVESGMNEEMGERGTRQMNEGDGSGRRTIAVDVGEE